MYIVHPASDFSVQSGDKYTALSAAIAIEHSLYRFYGKDEQCQRYNAKSRQVSRGFLHAMMHDFTCVRTSFLWPDSNACGDRAILFNLRDPDNPDFRRRVLSGEIQPERVSMMDSVEMASDELKRQRSIYASISLQSVTQGSAEDQYAVRHAQYL
jgi:hypothetical protein